MISVSSFYKFLFLITFLVFANSVYAQKRIIGYINTFNTPAQVDFTKITHLNIAFENADPDGNLSFTPSNNNFINAAHTNNVKVLVSICGGGVSVDPVMQKRYASLISLPNRIAFINKIVVYVNEHHLDGIDLDFEGPSINNDYSDFIIDLKKAFPSGKLLTASLSHDNGGNRVTPAAIKALDFLNVMAYDMGWGKSVHHSTYDYAATCMNWWVSNKNIAPDKLNLGVPFYGYTNQTGNEGISFSEIINLNGEGSAQKDELTSNGKILFYNGITTIRKKSQLVIDNHYGGIMIWQLAQDAKGSHSLLNAIHEVLK